MTNYNLADKELLDSDANQGYKVFTPAKTYIVLGRSNSMIEDVVKKNALSPEIEILKRPSGGEAVILSPNMLVVAIKMPLAKGLKPNFYFTKANGVIIDSLKEIGVKNLHTKGISDISIEDKKILGSAIFRGPTFMFYHAVLNISENVEIIGKYLKHPKREPDYRKGRKHTEFVTSLQETGYSVDNKALTTLIEKKLTIDFFSIFA
jgi:lipoate-protein ligase A